jgi:hypothetical protein
VTIYIREYTEAIRRNIMTKNITINACDIYQALNVKIVGEMEEGVFIGDVCILREVPIRANHEVFDYPPELMSYIYKKGEIRIAATSLFDGALRRTARSLEVSFEYPTVSNGWYYQGELGEVLYGSVMGHVIKFAATGVASKCLKKAWSATCESLDLDSIA